jgi:anaerobic ribonucleoside-triphosphate reductase
MLFTNKDRETWTFGGDYEQANKDIQELNEEIEKENAKNLNNPERYTKPLTPIPSENYWQVIEIFGRHPKDLKAPRMAEITYDKDMGWTMKEGVNG